MGCVLSAAIPISDDNSNIDFSKPAVEGVDGVVITNNGLHVKMVNKKCSKIRLDHCKEATSMWIEGVNYSFQLRFCYVSQRGYYPHDLFKANQDSYLLCKSLYGDKNSNLFGIFDGHGEVGDYCSHFAADQVSLLVIYYYHFIYLILFSSYKYPIYLEKELKTNGGVDAMDSPKMETIYKNSFIKCNKALHKSSIDDSYSGTTGITVYVKGDKLYVGNVGDSRAIIATKDEKGNIISRPLSIDQTPFRQDERERLKSKGAVIMTIDQIDGTEPMHENWGDDGGDDIDVAGDPPRVWDDSLQKPGCAFTRSLGDAIAEDIGVFAEPEILIWDITSQDQYIVIASDGVFEFLTSQVVVDMISKFEDPLLAAKHVVAESYRLWLQYDERTDDITMIIINLDDIRSSNDSLKLTSKSNGIIRPSSITGPERGVRTVISKEKRKMIAENWVKNDELIEEFDFELNSTRKSPEEIVRIENMISANFMFQSLGIQEKQQILQVMKLKIFKKDEIVIKEGDNGDEMYIIDCGDFSVIKRDDLGVMQQVFVYSTAGATFGELSLMYGCVRAATVKALTDGKLWCIGRAAYRAICMKKKQDNYLDIIKGIPGFNDVSFTSIQRLCSLTFIEEYKENSVILEITNSESLKLIKWSILVVVDGYITAKHNKKNKKIDINRYITFHDLNSKYTELMVEKHAKILYISKESLISVLGNDITNEIIDFLIENNTKNKINEPDHLFLNSERLKLPKSDLSSSKFNLNNSILLLGDYGYIGNFNNIKTNKTISMKILYKDKVHNYLRSFDKSQLFERQILACLNKLDLFTVPKIISTFQDDELLYLQYNDIFVCDLALAISNKAITNQSKPYYSACIWSAITSIHNEGLLHRFINPGAIYITNMGVPKLADFRCAKKMDGSKSFTMCGDALFFAPEQVMQNGKK